MLDTIKEIGAFLIKHQDLIITLLIFFGALKTKDIALISDTINKVIKESREIKLDRGNKADFIRNTVAAESKLTQFQMTSILKEKDDGGIIVDKKELVKQVLSSGDFKKVVRKVGKWVRKL